MPSGLVVDRDLFGDVWVGPYLALRPHLAFVAETGAGVEGYIVGDRGHRGVRRSSARRSGGRRGAPATPIRRTTAS